MIPDKPGATTAKHTFLRVWLHTLNQTCTLRVLHHLLLVGRQHYKFYNASVMVHALVNGPRNGSHVSTTQFCLGEVHCSQFCDSEEVKHPQLHRLKCSALIKSGSSCAIHNPVDKFLSYPISESFSPILDKTVDVSMAPQYVAVASCKSQRKGELRF